MKQNVKKKETYIPSSNGRDKLHVLYHTMRDLKHRLDLTLWNPDDDM